MLYAHLQTASDEALAQELFAFGSPNNSAALLPLPYRLMLYEHLQTAHDKALAQELFALGPPQLSRTAASSPALVPNAICTPADGARWGVGAGTLCSRVPPTQPHCCLFLFPSP